jgi:pilus assembly protein CpaE
MIGQRDIWIVSEDPAATASVKSVLEMYGLAELTRDCGGLDTMGVEARGDEGETAIVDIDPAPMQTLQELEQIITRFPNTRFVVMSEQMQSGLVMEAMNIGARHFIAKSMIEQELPRVIKRLRSNTVATDSPDGSVITVLSAGGGCGATTMAVNLAAELPRKEDEAALLIDLDNAYGSIAPYLGLNGSYGLAEVLAYDDESKIDPQLVTTTALKYTSRIHALINPVSVDFSDPAPLRYDRLDPVIQACRQAYPWVVIDAPRVSVALAAKLAHHSRFTLIVGQLSVKDIRASRSIQNALIQHGVTPGSIRHVINRYRSKHSLLSLDEAKRALGECDLQVIKNDFSSATESINMGQPLAQCAPRCGTRRDIQRLADDVATTQGNGHVSILNMQN